MSSFGEKVQPLATLGLGVPLSANLYLPIGDQNLPLFVLSQLIAIYQKHIPNMCFMSFLAAKLTWPEVKKGETFLFFSCQGQLNR